MIKVSANEISDNEACIVNIVVIKLHQRFLTFLCNLLGQDQNEHKKLLSMEAFIMHKER